MCTDCYSVNTLLLCVQLFIVRTAYYCMHIFFYREHLVTCPIHVLKSQVYCLQRHCLREYKRACWYYITGSCVMQVSHKRLTLPVLVTVTEHGFKQQTVCNLAGIVIKWL